MAESSSTSRALKDLDDKINACIQDISNLFGGIENLDKDFTVFNTDEESIEFQDMLKKLELLLSNCYQISEYILPHLDEIRKQNGVKYCETNLQLLKPSEKDTSLEKSEIHLLWNNICYYLEKYSYLTVFKNYIPLTTLHNHFNLCLVRNYCITLQNIFISRDVWQKYKDFRFKYLEIYNCDCKNEGSCFNCYLILSLQCIYEDHLLCYLGCFHPYLVTQTNILGTYSEFIHNEFAKLLKLIKSTFKSKNSVPQEIVNMILKFEKTFYKNMKTCYSCFVCCNLCVEMKSIIHFIQNDMATESLWNKLFILSILKLVEIISLFEDKVNILFNLRKDIRFHSHDEDMFALLEGSKLILPTESPGDSPFHESHQENFERSYMTNKTLFPWNWRLLLVECGFITEIQRALQTEVESMISVTIKKEQLILKTCDWKNLINSDRKLCFESLTIQTNTLLDSVLNTILILEKYVPILTSAVGVFQPFKYSFSHTVDTYVIDLLKHLEYVSEQGKNIYFLYIVCNNAIFLKNQLKYYCDIMEETDRHENEACSNNACRFANKLADETMDVLLNLHFKYVSCGILFDAESYNFADNKPFFEDERISYSIQMWKMYMKGLHHDMVYFLPQSFAQELYGKILSFSLDRFLMRYSASSVTEARYPQLSKDIYTILLCVTELIYPASSFVSEVIGKKEEFNESKTAPVIGKIHSNCCCLLSVLVTLTSPLCELHKVFKAGFPQPRLSVRSKYEYISPWLPWIRRELFSYVGQNKIMSNVYVWLAVKVCTTYRIPLPNCIIQAFTEQHCTLSILLLMQASDVYEVDPVLSKEVKRNKIDLAYSVSVLMLNYDNYSYILDIFLPVIEKTNSWDEFDASSSDKVLSERSWWYAGLYKALQPFFKSVLEEMTSFWCEINQKIKDPDALKQWLNFREELRDHVICVCENNSLNSFNENFTFSTETISFLCAKKILEKLYDNLMFLPQPLKYALICLDAHIINYMPEILPAEGSVYIQFLLSSTITCLKEERFIASIPEFVKEMAVITINALCAICKREVLYQNIHYRKKLNKLLAMIKDEFDVMRGDFDVQHTTANFEEIQDDVLTLTARKLIEKPEGINIILHLHKILCVNEEWIQRNLGIPEMLSSDIVVNQVSPSPLMRIGFDTPRESKDIEVQPSNSTAQKYTNPSAGSRGESFDSERSLEDTFLISQDIIRLHKNDEIYKKSELNLSVAEITPCPVFDFNPLNCFDKLGASSFTKVALGGPSLPWEALLSHLPILGVTEINFQVLFARRWDASSEATLTAEEKRLIEELKSLYKYEE